MEVQCRVIKILDVLKLVSKRDGSEVNKYGFVVEIQGQYAKHIVFSVFGDSRWDGMRIVEGQDMHVYFDIDAHEYNGRWYNEVSAWKAVPIVNSQMLNGGQQQHYQSETEEQLQRRMHDAVEANKKKKSDAEGSSDLPF